MVLLLVLKRSVSIMNVYYVEIQAEPTWRIIDQSVVRDIQGAAFILDSSENLAHPLNEAVDSPNDIAKLNNIIVYQKGKEIEKHT